MKLYTVIYIAIYIIVEYISTKKCAVDFHRSSMDFRRRVRKEKKTEHLYETMYNWQRDLSIVLRQA